MGKTNYNEIKVAAARTALFNNIKDVMEEINVHDVLKLSSGENLPTHKMIKGNYPVFGGGGETGLTHNIFNVDFETLAIGRVGARCGCVFKVPKKSWVTDNALYAMSFDNRFLLDFLIHYLNYVDLNQYANRAAQPVISLKRISSIYFPLIDIEKQKAFIEIIEKVKEGETHFGEEYSELNNALKSVDRINELQDQLSYQLTQLENLNQAILQEAVQGKLLPQDPIEEPASELLKHIKAEKAKSGKKEKPLPSIKPEEIPFEIPENWVWCRLDDIIDFRKESLRRGPFGSSITKSMFIPENGPNATKIYEQKNAIYKDYRLGNYFIDIVKHQNLKSFFASGGDIIISCAGTIGEAYLLPKESPVGIINQALLKIRLNEDVIINSYFLVFFKAIVKSKVNSDAKGSAMKNLGSIKYLRESLLIPLPPLSEQKRIVVEIEKQFAKTKQLKEHIIANQQATEHLLKALLHQAFEVKEVEEV